MALVESIIIEDNDFDELIVFSGVGEAGKDHSTAVKIEVSIGGERHYIPMATKSISRKSIPDLANVLNSEGYFPRRTIIENEEIQQLILKEINSND